jgi:basic membrane protein A
MKETTTPETRKWLFLLVTMLALVACTKEGNTIYQTNPDEEKPSTAPLVTVIYGPNSLGDRSYCDLIYKGVEAAAKKYGIRTLQLSPESEEQGVAYLETMFQQMEHATDTVRRLFITPSPVYDAYIRSNNKRLENNPNADLLYMETTTPLNGKGSTFFIDYYGAMYMSGCMVHYCSPKLVTLLLANPYTQSVVEAGEGFVAGYNDTPQQNNRSHELHLRYLSEERVGGFTIADSTAMRIYEEEKDYLEGPDNVVFVPICGGAMHAFFRILRYWLIGDCYVGIDGDMNDDKDYCLFSTLKHIDWVMEDYIGMWLNGSMPKHQTLGLADGATDVVTADYTFYQALWSDKWVWSDVLNMDSLRQVAIKKEEERYEK